MNQAPIPQFQNPNLGVISPLINKGHTCSPYSLPAQQGQAAVAGKPLPPYRVLTKKRGRSSFAAATFMPKPEPVPLPPIPINNIPNNSFNSNPGPSQTTVNVNVIKSLLKELIAMPAINHQSQAMSDATLPKQETVVSDHEDDPIDLDFDPAKLRFRHESVIRSLYADLPRQCATCGLRFKTQEEHSHHMDRHVRKNRAAKKSKRMLSRKFFPSSSTLVKAAEVNGTSAAAPVCNPNAAEEEKKYVQLLTVYADEDQKECALCKEAFDEYFNDETDDWMYRDAVYMDETKASTRRLYKSLIGRIVHAKCLHTKEEMESLCASG